jgi:hypothetical protein
MSHPIKPIKRRDGAGHIDPRYARDLLRKARETRNDADHAERDVAFLDGHHSREELAEELGEAFIEAVTSGEESEAYRHDRITEAENGGPFVETAAGEEFASGTDESNIAEATREPLPRTSKAMP